MSRASTFWGISLPRALTSTVRHNLRRPPHRVCSIERHTMIVLNHAMSPPYTVHTFVRARMHSPVPPHMCTRRPARIHTPSCAHPLSSACSAASQRSRSRSEAVWSTPGAAAWAIRPANRGGVLRYPMLLRPDSGISHCGIRNYALRKLARLPASRLDRMLVDCAALSVLH